MGRVIKKKPQIAVNSLRRQAKIEAAIMEALQRDGCLSKYDCWEVAFHMSDWLEDLDALHAFVQQPDRFTPAQIKTILTDFLVHVPNHVAAAGVLLTSLPVADIFGVGAVDPTPHEPIARTKAKRKARSKTKSRK